MEAEQGLKSIRPWSEGEKSSARQMAAGGMAPAEVYLSLCMDRCARYESALELISNHELRDHEDYSATKDIADAALRTVR